MEVSYDQAMDQLQSMFQEMDIQTLRAALAANKGGIEPTIDYLLRLQEQGSPNRGGFGHNANGEDDDNMFVSDNIRANGNQNQNKYPSFQQHENQYSNDPFGDFGGARKSKGADDFLARDEQEKADAEIAYQLQKEFMQQDRAIEDQLRNRASKQRSGNNNNYSQGHQQPGQRNMQAGQSNGFEVQNGEKKKKQGLMSKMKNGFKKIFDKKGKGKGPTKLTGAYADIDQLGGGDEDAFNPQSHAPQYGGFGNRHEANGFDGNFNDNNNFGNNYKHDDTSNYAPSFNHVNNHGNNDLNRKSNQRPQQHEEEDAPMQLGDILNANGMNNNNPREESFDFGSMGNANNNDQRYQSSKSATVDRDHFGY